MKKIEDYRGYLERSLEKVLSKEKKAEEEPDKRDIYGAEARAYRSALILFNKYFPKQ